MSTLLPRVGILESRIVSGAQSAKRKRWVCPQCAVTGVQHRRRVVALDPAHRLFKRPVFEGGERARGVRSTSTKEGGKEERWGVMGASKDPAQDKIADLNKEQDLRPDPWQFLEGMKKDWAESKDTRNGPDDPNEASRPQTSPQPNTMPAVEYAIQEWTSPGDTNDTLERPLVGKNTIRRSVSSRPRIHSIDYRAGVAKALRIKDPDLLFKSMVQACTDPPYIKSLPGPTFTQILTILDPDYFILPFREVHQKISEDTQAWLEIVPLRRILNGFTNTMENIIGIRLQGGQGLSLTDYKLRLRIGVSAGNYLFAIRAWKEMKYFNIKPDIECYNYMLEALIGNRSFLPDSRFRERVKRYNMKWREVRSSLGLPNRVLNLHWRPAQSYSVGPGGVRSQANEYFREILQNDHIPNEKTFTCLIDAYAKESALDGVSQILQSVWNIPDTVMPGYSGVKPLPKDSPVYPSERLLITIAHAFGINDDIPKALRLVDHVARGYDLEITPKVWKQLLEWTFVLSRPPDDRKERDGKMPRDSVLKLWNTMIAPPYNFTPTIPMYDYLIKSYRSMPDAASTVDMLNLILEATPLLETHRNDLLRANVELMQAEELAEKGEYPYNLRVLQRKVEALELLRRRNHLTVRKWHYLLFRRTFEPGQENLVPRLVRRFIWAMPDFVQYRIADVGIVRFNIRRTDEELGEQKMRFTEDQRLEHYRKQAEKARGF